MKTYCCLMVILCFLFSQMNVGSGLLTVLGHRTDHYKCIKNKGFCLYSNCPMYSKHEGTCYKGRANCCMAQ
uniref:Beta-defensin 1 n=2 Tax=Jaculus jaculus TaxID=51337 RepID=A0A8C5K0H4_JACJA